MGWRPKLSTLRNKSISLDSPDPGPVGRGGPAAAAANGPTYSSTGRLPTYGPTTKSPSSPVHPPRHSSENLPRISSSHRNSRVDLEKCSPQPASSPAHSPNMKGRQLPSSLYVVLYNFQPRRDDELTLTAGSTVHILDTVDPDWWRGRCTLTGGTGYLPSTYLARVLPGEMIFRVIQPCSLLSHAGEMFSLNRDQIVIGMPAGEGEPVYIVRTGEPGQPVRGRVPARFLVSV